MQKMARYPPNCSDGLLVLQNCGDLNSRLPPNASCVDSLSFDAPAALLKSCVAMQAVLTQCYVRMWSLEAISLA